MAAPFERREIPQVQGAKIRIQGAKVRTQSAKVRISTSRYGMQHNMQLQPPPPLTRYIGPAQYDAAINATCVRAIDFCSGSCTDCCIMLCLSYLDGCDGGCSCMLCWILYMLLMLALTFAPYRKDWRYEHDYYNVPCNTPTNIST